MTKGGEELSFIFRLRTFYKVLFSLSPVALHFKTGNFQACLFLSMCSCNSGWKSWPARPTGKGFSSYWLIECSSSSCSICKFVRPGSPNECSNNVKISAAQLSHDWESATPEKEGHWRKTPFSFPWPSCSCKCHFLRFLWPLRATMMASSICS